MEIVQAAAVGLLARVPAAKLWLLGVNNLPCHVAPSGLIATTDLCGV